MVRSAGDSFAAQPGHTGLVITLPPAFAGAQLIPLGEGWSNRSFKLRLGERDYFLRLAGPESDWLGIDRGQELAALQLAEAAGLAPPLIHAEPERGLLIQAWIPQPVWTPARARSPDGVRRLARLSARLQRLPLPPGRLDLAARLSTYLSAIKRVDPRLPPLYRQIQDRLADLSVQAPVFCHNDLHAGNLLGSRPWVVDWEYAAGGDAAFELAVIWRHCGLDESRARLLLAGS